MKVRSNGSHSVVSGSGHRRLDYPMPGGSTAGEEVGARDDDDAAIAPTGRRRRLLGADTVDNSLYIGEAEAQTG
jgi:hypothetical protein